MAFYLCYLAESIAKDLAVFVDENRLLVVCEQCLEFVLIILCSVGLE
jgi:hypothetical protein